MVEEEGEMKDLDPREVGLEAVLLGVEAVCFRSTVLGREALQRLDEVEEEEVAGGWEVV